MNINGPISAMLFHPSGLGAYLESAAPIPVGERTEFLGALDTFVDGLDRKGVATEEIRKLRLPIAHAASGQSFMGDLKGVAKLLRQVPNTPHYAVASDLLAESGLLFVAPSALMVPPGFGARRLYDMRYQFSVRGGETSLLAGEMADRFGRSRQIAEARFFYRQEGMHALKEGRKALAQAVEGQKGKYYRYAVSEYKKACEWFARAHVAFERCGSLVLPQKAQACIDKAKGGLEHIGRMAFPGREDEPEVTPEFVAFVLDALVHEEDEADLVRNARVALTGDERALHSFLYEAGIYVRLSAEELLYAVINRRPVLVMIQMGLLLNQDQSLLRRLFEYLNRRQEMPEVSEKVPQIAR